MIEVPVYHASGEQGQALRVNEQALGGEVRPALLKQAYVMYHANRRQGSAQTRGRGEKKGSRSKLYRQKGTGRARRGQVRTNIMRGGGPAFPKEPKSWRQAMPKKMRRLATRNALLSKAVDGEIKVVEDLGIDAPKTRQFAAIMEALEIDRTCLAVFGPASENARLSARNLPHVQTLPIEHLNAYDLLSRRFLLVQKDALLGWLSDKAPSALETAGEAS